MPRFAARSLIVGKRQGQARELAPGVASGKRWLQMVRDGRKEV